MKKNAVDEEDSIRRLRRAGIGPTYQRIKIADVLFSKKQHLSAEQLLKFVNRTGQETSRATVYNTLNLFVGRGLVRRVVVDEGKIFYDPNMQPHYHVYDIYTQELIDVPVEGISIVGVPKMSNGAKEVSMDLTIRVSSAPPK